MKKNTDYSENFKLSGLKKTKHRIAILDILGKGKQPIAAEEVYNELKKNDISINLSTVYRTLEILTDRKLVTKLSIIGDNRSLFECNKMVHRHYLVCIGCKNIVTINHCPLGDYEEALEQETHFKISGHKLDIYGLCSQCQKRDQGKK